MNRHSTLFCTECCCGSSRGGSRTVRFWPFLLEFVRGDERLHWLGLDVAQEISIGLFVIGVALWFGLRAKTKKANG